ncbi:hypothetical protein Lalb_Chr25g0280211 [Lupinus albus]|uniref:Uncharacterized protein n=1 Tax=Lupinus albus TaxID=3870 RepID=A0A6A4NDB2_LUPAL|nr:hypothetical protein Lalb_Chr25g0280211 [Lupinus albus]
MTFEFKRHNILSKGHNGLSHRNILTILSLDAIMFFKCMFRHRDTVLSRPVFSF